ncbi:MAG: hypothetical protein ACYC2H_10230 [Thermoplasmatota archaeon]
MRPIRRIPLHPDARPGPTRQASDDELAELGVRIVRKRDQESFPTEAGR